MFKIFDSGHAEPGEREAVYNLLIKNNVNFFETPDSIKTRSAYWTHAEDEYRKARTLINAFQAEYVSQSRQKYKETLARDYRGSSMKWFFRNVRMNGLFVLIILLLLTAYSLVRAFS